MREICMSGSMRGVWKRSKGQSFATAPHPDSTELRRSCYVRRPLERSDNSSDATGQAILATTAPQLPAADKPEQ